MHSSEIRDLCSMKCSSKMLQNLLYFTYAFTPYSFFFVFTLVYKGEKSKVAKNEKYYVGFLIQKI